jgi:hypothetical protein
VDQDNQVSQSEQNAAAETGSKQAKERGLPLWMTLVGLLVAFGIAVAVGARVVPVLSALILPPDPQLPSGKVTLSQHTNKDTGYDEWLYSTPTDSCTVALFYQQWLSNCDYDPDVSCQSGKESRKVLPSDPTSSSHIATCTGLQTIGSFKITWTAYITEVPTGTERTFFRVIREIGS